MNIMNKYLLGPITGDIIGSAYESVHNNTEDLKFALFSKKSRFTDDTILTIASAHAIMDNLPFDRAYRHYTQKYPNRGYGKAFRYWIDNPYAGPYGSFGNGSAMRVAAIGYSQKTPWEVINKAYESSAVTHNHPEAIRGAQAIALAAHYAFKGIDKEAILTKVLSIFRYDLSIKNIDLLRQLKNCKAEDTVPLALYSFYVSTDYESCIRTAVLLGGDTDTIAAMAGSIAYPYYKEMPKYFKESTWKFLPTEFKDIINRFDEYIK